MKIQYLGWSSFLLTSSDNIKILFDPFDPKKVGLKWKKRKADIVCISHGHKDHNYVDGVSNVHAVIQSPGEYEIKGVQIYGFLTLHDNNEGQDRGFNTMYQAEVDGLSVAHLGDIGQKLSQDQVEDLGTVDILILPVGGTYTITYETAAEIVAQIEPSVVVPCHYDVPDLKIKGIETVDKFLEEMGVEDADFKDSIKFTSSGQLPEETEVIPLNIIT